MIVNEIIRRVRHIRTSDENTGSAFFVELAGRQYLVTACHGVDHITGSSSIEVQHAGGWQEVEVDLVGHDPQLDVSVLAPREAFGPIPGPVTLSTDNMVYGQDAFFLGFPHRRSGDVGALTDNYPLPFVKRALISNFSQSRLATIYLDGISNPGFSGGPVVLRIQQTGTWQIVGVVTGYLPVRAPVLDGEDEVDLQYETNSGIMTAGPITGVLDLIGTNPAGLLV